MKKIDRILIIIEALLVLAVLVMAVINIFVLHNSDFWEISIAQVLTLLVAIVVAFWATQRKNDKRKIKEQIEKITEKIQMEVSSPDFVNFDVNSNPEEVQKRITMATRKLTNCINILWEYSKILDISEEIRYIEDQIKGYRDFVSVKVGDLDYLSKSETHLRKYAENINSKCDFIISQLYTKL